MIACYAWTDTQIINMMQICLTRFQGESTNLFVLKLDRLSKLLLKELRENNIFRTVYEITPPTLNSLSEHSPRLPGLKTIFLGRVYQQYFNNVIIGLAGDNQYDIF